MKEVCICCFVYSLQNQIGVDSAMMLVTFLNVLSHRYYEGKLIDPCIRMVTTVLGEGGRGEQRGEGRGGERRLGLTQSLCFQMLFLTF